MTFKSLLIAATMAGGLVLGASAANAQVEKYTITGSDPTYLGSFEADIGDLLPISTPNNFFYDAYDGTGVYTGVTEISFSPLFSTYTLFDDSTPLPYVIDTGTNPASIVNSTDTITVSAAPEPGVWLLMIAGVAMIGSALRVSRKSGALAAA